MAARASWKGPGRSRRFSLFAGMIAIALGLAGCGSHRVVGSKTSASAPASTIPSPIGASTTIGNASGVVVFQPTSTDISAIETAFQTWEMLPATCPVQAVSMEHFATISATGTSWAIAGFQPASTCVLPAAAGSDGTPPGTFDPTDYGPFQPNVPVIGVFEQMSGATWQMNEEGSNPFPCPAPGGVAPQSGNAALPPPVLAAWQLSYAQNCAAVSYTPEPGG